MPPAAFFTGAGVLHFTNTAAYERIMPDYVPHQRELVYLSGVAEIAGGLALLVPRLRGPARWWLIALLVAVFPANLHMALNPDQYPKIHPALLWGRLPLQGLMIAWVYAVTRPPPRGPRARAAAAAAQLLSAARATGS